MSANENAVVLTETDMDADDLFAALAAMAKKLRDTAAGLDDKSIHPAHAANRLRKMARGIDGGK